MSKPDRLSYIALLVSGKRSALVRAVNSNNVSPAQFMRIKRRIMGR